MTIRYLAPGEREEARKARDRGARVLRLLRRGVDHGSAILASPEPPDPDARERWLAGSPIFRPGLVRLDSERELVEATRASFDALRRGVRFLDLVERRLWDDAVFRYSSSSVDQLDERDIEKVFIDVVDDREQRMARDLWVKASWVARDEDDMSLRIRFSFGHEATKDWLEEDPRSDWADKLTAAVFPETRVVTASDPLRELLGTLHDAELRMTECIVYDNAPGGGAVFHHDADPGQRGVVFTQLSGSSAWLAAPRDELAGHVAALGGAALGDDEPPPEQWRLLNADPELTGRLVESGGLRLLDPGDVLVLPSPSPERACWHSVFGLGRRPAIGLSFALFDVCEGLG